MLSSENTRPILFQRLLELITKRKIHTLCTKNILRKDPRGTPGPRSPWSNRACHVTVTSYWHECLSLSLSLTALTFSLFPQDRDVFQEAGKHEKFSQERRRISLSLSLETRSRLIRDARRRGRSRVAEEIVGIYTYPFQLLEVLPQEGDRVLGPADAQLHYTVFQDLLDIVPLNVFLALA